MTLFVVLCLVGFGWYLMEPDERHRLLRSLSGGAAVLRHSVTRQRIDRSPFQAALRARTRFACVTTGVAAAQAAVFIVMFVGPGAISDPATLIWWGGNFAPTTTNGEWGRLITSLFVHSGPLHLLVNLLALLQIGLILERLVGHLAFSVVYLTTGILGGLVGLHMTPVEVTVGASGAVFGLYGSLLAAGTWGLIHRSALTLPLGALKMLGPTAAVFGVYNVLDGSLGGTSEWVAFAAGLTMGLVLTRDVSTSTPRLRAISVAAAAALVIIVASALSLRGIANVRPELERLVEIEMRLAGDYDKLVRQFRLGRTSAAQLAQMIERNIGPELEGARARLEALRGVPAEHAALVSEAETYLALRGESWRTRAEALKRGDMNGLRAADRTERASLQVFERVAAALGGLEVHVSPSSS